METKIIKLQTSDGEMLKIMVDVANGMQLCKVVNVTDGSDGWKYIHIEIDFDNTVDPSDHIATVCYLIGINVEMEYFKNYKARFETEFMAYKAYAVHRHSKDFAAWLERPTDSELNERLQQNPISKHIVNEQGPGN